MLTATERTFSESENKWNVDKCLICWIGFEPDDRITELSCSHIWHSPCASRLSKCPLCRKAIEGRDEVALTITVSASRIQNIFDSFRDVEGTPDHTEVERAVDAVINDVVRELIYEVENSFYPEFYDAGEHKRNILLGISGSPFNTAQKEFACKLIDRQFSDSRIIRLAKKTDQIFARNHITLLQGLSIWKKYLFFKTIPSENHRKIERGLSQQGLENFYSKIYYNKIKFLITFGELCLLFTLASIVAYLTLPLFNKE
ncbi:MAG: hypothetical protein K940chlam3_00333 [Chlamydiae bacterium]|nr:hypothetical protein [Chlamydiota bacterium]